MWITIRLQSESIVLYFRRIFCDVAKQWLHLLEAEDVPVVVCMTHADLRYNECMEHEDGNPEPTPYKIQEIGADLMVNLFTHISHVNV